MKFPPAILLASLWTILQASPLSLSGQGKSRVSGKVTDMSGSPVSNAFILVDGKNTGSYTNTDGVYRIRVRKDAAVIGIMTFSMGFMEESIAGRKYIDFRFSRISNQPPPGNEERIGEEVVDMGYSSVRRRDVTNSVGIFDFKSGKKTYSSVKDMIREIPGINAKVFNMYGPVGPITIVDGNMFADINSIQPSMVESIVFLRDASAAIYGSLGFGGVILIRTKRTTLDH